MDRVQPPDTPISRMQEIVDHLDYGRFRVASLRLLALDAVFFSDLSSCTDMETLWHGTNLLQCLAQTSYTRSFSKPVDRAVNKLLLHVVVGCENLSAQHRARVCDDHVRWLVPTEMKVKEMLEILRCFLGFITLQDAVHPPVKDANLTDVRRRLQCLCPRISNLTSWSPSPEPQSSRIRRTRASSHVHNLRPRSRPESTPDPTSTVGRSSPADPATPPPLTPSLSPCFTAATTPSPGFASSMYPSPGTGAPPTTIPTQLLSTLPQYRVAPPPALRLVNGMLEEVTQPYEMSWPVEKFNVGFRPATPEPFGDGSDWRKRQMQAFAQISPVSSPAGGGGNEMWGMRW